MIEKMKEGQLDRVMDIWLQTNILAHPFIPREHWENLFDTVKGILPSADIFIYRDDDEIKGFIGITDNQYIAGLFVSSEHQGQRVGYQLLQHCKQIYPHLELDVFIKNDGAVKFYEKNQFAISESKMNLDFNHEEYRMGWSAGQP